MVKRGFPKNPQLDQSLAHLWRDGGLKIKLAACHRRMKRLAGLLPGFQRLVPEKLTNQEADQYRCRAAPKLIV